MYRKNTAGQFICVQLLLTATGAVATGLAPAARRCIDGTFAAGGGTFTEDGATGSYRYAMAQADTNGNDISIIVTAIGAIPVCVNFVTTAADPTDAVRLGLTALPNAAANAAGGLPISTAGGLDLDEMNVDIEAIQTSTAGLTFTGAGKVDASVRDWIGGTIPAVNVTGVPLVDLKYTLGTISPATAGSVRADAVTGAVGSVTGNVGGSVASVTAAVALTAGERTSVADALLDRDMSTGADSGSTTVRTARQALRFLRNKWAIAAGTLTVYKEDDATSSWTSAVTTDGTAQPIVSNDPAGP